MGSQLLRLNGILNLDDGDELIVPGSHKYAKNLRFFGTSHGMKAQNIPGNVLVQNASLPSGTNICIGGFYDQKRKRIIFFNYNSLGKNGIYSYDLGTDTITKIFLCFTDSATDILNFSPNYPVHSAAVIYRNTSDGDLLYWTDENNRPKYINIDTVSSLAPFTSDMINAAKNAPLSPPTVTYRDDTTITVNNLKKQLFEFCYRWKYKNLEYSTTSPYSKLPLPIGYSNVNTQNDPTKNNNIRITFQTGGNDFSGVELFGRVSLGTTYGDWFSIVTLDKTDYNYSPSTNYTFDFYNDAVYTTVDIKQTDLFFSYLPDKANTLEALNGNVIVYGGITDGYAKIARSAINVNLTSGVSTTSAPSISFFQTSGSTVFIVIGPIISTGTVYRVRFSYVSGVPQTPIDVSYTTLVTDTQTTIANALAALINSVLLSATNAGVGQIQITPLFLPSVIFNVVVTASFPGSQTASPAWDWACPERLGIIYFDDRGKTNGVISFVTDSVDTTDFGVTTPPFSTTSNIVQIPFLYAFINHQAPSWATSYQWVRAAVTPKLLYWISNDYQTDANYLYICIQNLIYTQSKNTGYVPSYEFVNGDRIKFCAAYNSGSGVYSPYDVQLDMEILGIEQRVMSASPNPAINGAFIKVAKPSTFPSTPYQPNMLIKLYTPYLRQTDQQQVFYEWGEKYNVLVNNTTIINYTTNFGVFVIGETVKEAVTNAEGTVVSVSPTQLVIIPTVSAFVGGLTFTGLTSGASGNCVSVAAGSGVRYHQGQIQNQGVTTPATFQWTDGDCYFKNREFYLNVNDAATTTAFMIDQNYSDYFVSAINSNGRAWVIDNNAATLYRSNQYRWGQAYIQDTNINQLNIFYANDFDTVDLGKGAIRRFKCRNRIMRIFQERGCGQVGVYNKFIQDSGATRLLETSDTIITTNNIQYYEGEFGIGTQPCGLVSGTIQDYFCDPVRGYQLRLSGDGIIPISEKYKGQFFIRDLITPYNNTITKSNGFTSFIMGAYNYLDEEYICILPGGTFGSITNNPYSFSFNETRNGYCCFYDFNPEWIVSCQDLYITFKDGNLYRHNSSTYCNFYGVQYGAAIQLPFNQNLEEKKSWMSLSQLSDSIWPCTDIYTNVKSYGSTNQRSTLVSQEFTRLENIPMASFKRDINSRGGKVNGQFLKGNYLVARFEIASTPNLVFLSGVSVMTKDSPVSLLK